jgi:LmbE family N-acetylglucosaminyl deacetylase
MVYLPARALAVTPHGDDVTLFAGGTLAGWVRNGCQVVVIRVTQDEKDSVEYPLYETIKRNREEFEEAMSVLGVQSTVNLGYPDCELRDASYGQLRGQLIRRIREFMPEVVLCFDPTTVDDDNPDHGVCATATADSAWAAAYPNFHPEHREKDLAPHVLRGSYYFTTQFVRGETVVDIRDTLEQKIRAVACHRTMMRALLANQKARIAAAGFHIPALEAIGLDDYETYWAGILRAAAALAAQGTDLEAAERFRSTLLTREDPLVQYLLSL